MRAFEDPLFQSLTDRAPGLGKDHSPGVTPGAA